MPAEILIDNKRDISSTTLASSLLYVFAKDSRIAHMRKTTKVLALGPEEWIHAVRTTLPNCQRNGLVGVQNLWALCALPQAVEVDVAVIHHSLAQDNLRYAAEYIRRRWPSAVIVVMGEPAKHLDDPLYDRRAGSEMSPEELVWLVETSVTARKRSRRNVRPVLGGVWG